MSERLYDEGFERQPNQITPEQRTIDLFNLDVADLTRSLDRMIVGLAGTAKRVRFDSVMPYSKTPHAGEREIGANYLRGKEGVTIENMEAGTYWAYPLAHRKMKEGGNVRQALIAAKDHDGASGACVQVLRSSRLDSETGEYVSMPREGDTSAFFGFDNNETVQMRFLDDSDVLYLVRGQNTDLVEVPTPDQGTEVANRYLRNLVGE